MVTNITYTTILAPFTEGIYCSDVVQSDQYNLEHYISTINYGNHCSEVVYSDQYTCTLEHHMSTIY